MGKMIRKKTWPEYFEAIISGKKKYELRLNDFEVEEGDILLLEEWDPKTKSYTGRQRKKFLMSANLNSMNYSGQKKR